MMKKFFQEAQSVTKAYDEFLQAAQEYGSGRLWEHQLNDVPMAQAELYELRENYTEQWQMYTF